VEFVTRAVLIGAGATAVLDLWAVVATRLFGFPAPSWDLVGRWVGHFPRGQFVHRNIAEAAPVRGELMIGWVTHYVTGVVYAALLLAVWGLGWARHPTLLPALIVSLLALAAPFFIMQPAMGAGIAGSKTPSPIAARLRSVAGHTAFGIGLYAAGVLSALLSLP
jgi:hypothetical protein